MQQTVFFYMPGACSLTGIVALELIGKPYSLCRVTHPELSNPAFRAINSQGKVPALKIDARNISENIAIFSHLADKNPSVKLLPATNTDERDDANMWLSYLASSFHTAFKPMFAPMRFIDDSALFDAIKAKAIDVIRTEYAYVNKHLAVNQYLLGDTQSILDVHLFTMARWGAAVINIKADFPHLARHMEFISSEKAVQFGLSVEQDASAAEQSAICLGHIELATA